METQANIAALVFYRRLFALDPSLRPLFKSEIEAQGQKLMDMLRQLLDSMNRPKELQATLAEMGRKHATYGVRDEHYAMVGTAMLGMLGEVLGTRFTPETCAAWTQVYGVMAGIMQQAARQAPPDDFTAQTGAGGR